VPFMPNEAERLTRERWRDVNDFAEELKAIWQNAPVTIDGPVTINNSTGGSSMIINQGDVGDTAITINSNPIPSIEPGNIVTTITNSSVTNIYGDGTTEHFDDPPNQPALPTPGDGDPVGGGGGGGFPGRVVSGSGNTYQVDVYQTSLAASPVLRTVTQLDILAGESIAPGTWVVVGTLGAGFFMQSPVWGSDLP
jgi:hypothetical protein